MLIIFNSQKIYICLLVFSLILLTSCATSTEHYKTINKSLDQENYKQSVEVLKKARENGNYKEKDRVLYYLELGMANHYAENYKRSIEQLDKAEKAMQELFTKSISNVGKSLLTNDNELPYRGEPYENIYINLFKALNYAQLDDRSAAKVEIRKIYEKLSNMERKYKRQADSYKEAFNFGSLVAPGTKEALADSAANLETADLNFHNSALGRYMGYSMYMAEQDWDDAEIDMKKIKEAFMNQPDIYNFQPPRLLDSTAPPEGEGVVHALALLGRGPIKIQKTLRITLSDDLGEIKLALPEMKMRGSNFDKVKIYKDDQHITDLDKIESINRVAKAVFEMKEPLILFKTLLRVAVKEYATTKTVDQANDKMGLVLAIAGEIYKEVSEQADLRTCHLLPGEVHVKSFHLPAGAQQLEARYYNNGRQVDVKKITINVRLNSLNLLEVVNLN